MGKFYNPVEAPPATTDGELTTRAQAAEIAAALLAGGIGGSSGFVAAGELFDPVKGTAPASMVTYSVNSAGQTLTNTTMTYWDGQTVGATATPAGTKRKFNTLGQRWQAVSTANTDGVKNCATPQMISGVIPPHCMWFEFGFFGDKIDIGMLGISNPWDFQVWVDDGGGLYRISDLPISDTGTGLRYVRLTFPTWAHRKIAVRAGNAYFSHVRHETSAIVSKAPDRHLGIDDGDSYNEDRTSMNPGSSQQTFHCGGVNYHLFELTGWAWAGRSQGGTGRFNNGSGATVTDDTASSYNGTRWGSASRKTWVLPDIAAKALMYVFNGTINDGEKSGGKAGMKASIRPVYDWVKSVDPLLTLVHVGPEPYNGAVAGNVHDLNMQGQAEAMAEFAAAGGRGFYVNAFGPTSAASIPPATEPWWTGTGYNDSPSDSQQARLTGGDQIHGNFRGYRQHATRIVNALRPIPIPAQRAYESVPA